MENETVVIENNSPGNKLKTMKELVELVWTVCPKLCPTIALIQIESENNLSVISEFFKPLWPNAEIKQLKHDFSGSDVYTLNCGNLKIIIVDKNVNERLVRSTTFNYAIITDVNTLLFKDVIGCQAHCVTFYK